LIRPIAFERNTVTYRDHVLGSAVAHTFQINYLFNMKLSFPSTQPEKIDAPNQRAIECYKSPRLQEPGPDERARESPSKATDPTKSVGIE